MVSTTSAGSVPYGEEYGGLGCTHDIFVNGTLIFVASVMKGLIILEFSSE